MTRRRRTSRSPRRSLGYDGFATGLPVLRRLFPYTVVCAKNPVRLKRIEKALI